MPSPPPKTPSAIYRLIWQAMRGRQNIAFEYNGRPREGSPIILGYSDTGRETLKLYQTGGRTSQGRLPDWRDFYLDQIRMLTMKAGEWREGTQPQASAGIREIRRRRHQYRGDADTGRAAGVWIDGAARATRKEVMRGSRMRGHRCCALAPLAGRGPLRTFSKLKLGEGGHRHDVAWRVPHPLRYVARPARPLPASGARAQQCAARARRQSLFPEKLSIFAHDRGRGVNRRPLRATDQGATARQ